MKIVLAGGSGLLGRALAAEYAADGHDVHVLTRSLPPGGTRREAGSAVTLAGWRPDGRDGPWIRALSAAHAVINLAGASIGDRRWSPARKVELRDSRVLATRSLVAGIQSVDVPPAVFVSSSGVGYYGGSLDDEVKTEASPPGQDFVARLCQEWEAAAARPGRDGVRVAIVRSATVLDSAGGALPRMITPFRLFAGGPLASGRQYMSWVHRRDWIDAVRWIVDTPEAAGPFNVSAPNPVPNREFARALGRTLRRPALVPVPGFALRIALGEFARYVVTGQRVIPERLCSAGYEFRYPELEGALRELLR